MATQKDYQLAETDSSGKKQRTWKRKARSESRDVDQRMESYNFLKKKGETFPDLMTSKRKRENSLPIPLDTLDKLKAGL